MMKYVLVAGAMIMASTFLTSCASGEKSKFENTHIKNEAATANLWDIAKAYWNDSRKSATPKSEVPVQPLSAQSLQADDTDAIFRLGHSTILLRLDGDFILLDPVFSERAFPVQWMGPKRFHQTPLTIEELPPIKAVVISHDHYDHLDKNAIKALNAKVETFVTPLKVGNHLRDWGIADDKIVELNWWQHTQLDQIKITATPSQHFSGRSLFDKDETLWASWVIQSWDANIYFSGDTGYFPGFKEIGEKLGPFDVTLMEAGAYNELWSDIHMMPEQTVQAHMDLKGKVMVPIHNGTFDLALHEWYEPLETIHQLALKNDVAVATPVFGEQLNVKSPQYTKQWWHEMLSEGSAENLQSVSP